MNTPSASTSISKRKFSRSLINLLRMCRTAVYVLINPFDYLVRVLNGKADFPPIYLRRHVGPLRTFEASGAEFLAYLRLFANLKSDSRVLDVGCGCGLMALYLRDFLGDQAQYVGVDLDRSCIRWSRKHISRSNPNFQFEHIDINSPAYNAHGKELGSEFVFAYDSGVFDVILFKSVFTHLRPPEVENYLRETSRMLNDGGCAVLTFFLLNEEQRKLQQTGGGALAFNFGETSDWRYVYEHSPESASAYEEDYVLGLLKKHGLRLEGKARYGTWAGRVDGLSFQDLLIVTKT